MYLLYKHSICFFLILFFFLHAPLIGQNFEIGTWRDHLNYSSNHSVAKMENQLYIAGSNAMFTMDIGNESIGRLNKTNALSDIGISIMRKHPKKDLIICGYIDGNLDVVYPLNSENISDIKESQVPFSKRINNFYFNDNEVYIACGFGIVWFDLTKKEVKETFLLGSNNTYINVLDISIFNDTLWAISNTGLYKAALSSTYSNTISWQKDLFFSGKNPAAIEQFGGYFFTVCENESQDSIFKYENNQWQYIGGNSTNIQSLEVADKHLVAIANDITYVLATNLDTIMQVQSYSTNRPPKPNHAIYDVQNKRIWIADQHQGLGSSYHRVFKPNGPFGNASYGMDFSNGQLWVTGGNIDLTTGGNGYFTEGLYGFNEGLWASTRETSASADSLRDIVYVKIDPSDNTHAYAASTGQGLIEIKDDKIIEVFGPENATLQDEDPSNAWSFIGIGGIDFDDNGNLWVSNLRSPQPLHVLQPNGQWTSFQQTTLEERTYIGKLLCSSYGPKWIAAIDGEGSRGIVVFDHNTTIDDTTDDASRLLSSGEGNGNLPSNLVYAITEDKKGDIWVGTFEGLVVFYSPSDMINNPSDAQKIYTEKDGFTEELLIGQIISDIEINGANQKWVAAYGTGVFLLSEDGTEEIYAFNKTNSPLITNEIYDIEIDDQTGEVFFASAEGIVSFRAHATEGKNDFSEIEVFPNPVYANYTGLIGINGLTKNAQVKITDMIGNLVYETTAEGGQAVWNGKDLEGKRIKTGVYPIYIIEKDGGRKAVQKVLFLNN